MKTLSELVKLRNDVDAILAGPVDASVRFCLELARGEVVRAIRAQSCTREILEAA